MLVLGAVPRLARTPRILDSVACGVGVLLLANSRPYEGLIYAVLLGLWLLFRLSLLAKRFEWQQLAKAAIPVLLVLGAGGTCMLWYFKQTTGHATLMPYMLNSQQYEPTRPFLWNKPEPMPTYNHVVMRTYYERQAVYFEQAHHLRTWLEETFRKTTSILMFYFWPGAFLSLFMLRRTVRSLEGRIALASIIAVWCAVTVEIWPMTLHYASPMMGAAVLLLVCSIRESRRVRLWGLPVGIQLSRVVPALCLLSLLFRIGAQAADARVPQYGIVPFFTVAPGNLERQHVIDQLNAVPGKQSVIVRYGRDHGISREWVYNSAQIDKAKVV